jgi:hypothetical protein
MIFFHKYYLYNLINNSIININNKDFSLLCISCFLLATKSSDSLMRIDDILDCIYKNNILKNNNNLLEYHKKLIFNYEYEVLESLGFDVNTFNLTYRYISYLFDLINNKIQIEKDETKLKKIKEYLFAQIRYSFILPFFLKFNISTIVLSNINILLKQLLKNNFNIKQVILNLKEYEEVTQSDIDNFYSLYEFFFIKKKNNEIMDKNEINESKSINMDIIKKINQSNLNDIQYCPINNKQNDK